MSEWKEGDRVRMWSECARLSYGATSKSDKPSRQLRGTVELWSEDRADSKDPPALVVRWDDWPLFTPLPNPHVKAEDAPKSDPPPPPEAA